MRFIDNGAQVLAVAHVDYVDCGMGADFVEIGNLVFNTRLDDRLGVHIILDLLPVMGIAVDVLLTDDEEIGASTAGLFKTDKRYNWIFQFDRRGQDAVTYDYDCMDSHVQRHFELGRGSFSDICKLEHLGCGGINVGTGYYNEHTPRSFADLSHTAAQVERFQHFYHELKDQHIQHIPYFPTYGSKGSKAATSKGSKAATSKGSKGSKAAGAEFWLLPSQRPGASGLRSQGSDQGERPWWDFADDTDVNEYDRKAREMGYFDVDDIVAQESLPGRAAALDLIDDFCADMGRSYPADYSDDYLYTDCDVRLR